MKVLASSPQKDIRANLGLEGVWVPLSGATLCVSTFCLPDVTPHDQISQASPLCTCILLTTRREVGTAWE